MVLEPTGQIILGGAKSLLGSNENIGSSHCSENWNCIRVWIKSYREMNQESKDFFPYKKEKNNKK